MALIQKIWVTERWTSLGWRIAGRARTRLHACVSGVHHCIPSVNTNFKNHKFMNSFKSPSETGRAFFRLLALGQAAPIYKLQFLDATL
jgi:hypothetical protein